VTSTAIAIFLSPEIVKALGIALRVVVGLAAALYLVNQVRRPSKWTGRLFTALMNASHSSLTDWGLAHLRIESHFTILDVGCGGGRTIEKLAARASAGKVYGVDYADGSVAASRATNAGAIARGRVEIQQATVSRLPFPDGTFDLVTAVETQYYWPDLPHDMREILRVLKRGGTCAIILESYNKDSQSAPSQQPRASSKRTRRLIFVRLTSVEHRTLFAEAGFTNVEVFEESTKGWICVTGNKPV
jgi:ubiquinone/menaquinone biosynthesis C-methylase UbiE